LAKWVRALLVLFGIVALAFSFMVLAYPAIGAITLVFFLAITFMVHGIESIVSAV